VKNKDIIFIQNFYFVTRDTVTKLKHKPVFIKSILHNLMKILFLLTAKDIIKPGTTQINSSLFSPLAGTLHALKPPVMITHILSK